MENTSNDNFKKIAVIVASINEEYQNRIIKGIQKYVAENKGVVEIYSAFGGIVKIQSHENGENTIYDLINFDNFDGAILMTNTISSDDVTYDVIKAARNSKIPIVSIDYENDNFYAVITDNYGAQKKVVEHFVKDHGMTKFAYVSGPPTNPDAIQRLRAFRETIEENGINYDPHQVYEGHFLESDGSDAVNYFLNEYKKLPEAFICGNDEMAMGVILELEKLGYKVPDDVSVSGYDNIYKARNYWPTITTISRPLFETGYKSAEIIYNVLSGKDQPRVTVIETELKKGDSCGCNTETENDIKEYKRATYHIIDSYMTGIPQVNRMNIYFTSCNEFDDFIDEMKKNIALLDCDSFCIAVCDKWLTSCYQTEKEDIENKVKLTTYTDNMLLLLTYHDGKFKTGDQVRLKDIKPKYIEERPGDIIYYSPLHYQEECIGYCMIRNSTYPLDSKLFYTWILNVDTALEHMHQKTRVNAAFNRFSGLYGIDQLTNISNRVGFYQTVQKKFDMCVQFNQRAMIMFLDMDGMKIINDTYGHNEGDYALISLAAAIKKSCNKNQICARFGGDEFVVFQAGCGELSGEELSIRIKEMIYEHNRTFGKPYNLSASIGYYITKPTPKMPLSKMIEIADEKMYEEKKSRHLQRG